GIGLLIGYFLIFYSPFNMFFSGFRVGLLQAAYILVACIIRFGISLIQNKIAQKHGEELPYPDFPWD
ncbi:MAG: hypothetical protein Q4C45_06735, partial [Oscillospiraceae bacterium]|nr:hypothetical protein [Oscillospiraceae bacterium]